jgi:hypothetical protein
MAVFYSGSSSEQGNFNSFFGLRGGSNNFGNRKSFFGTHAALSNGLESGNGVFGVEGRY